VGPRQVLLADPQALHPRNSLASVGMERPSPMLLGKAVECNTPATRTHQRGADLGVTPMPRGITTILIKYHDTPVFAADHVRGESKHELIMMTNRIDHS